MSFEPTTDPAERERIDKERQTAIDILRADYQMTIQMRQEAGVSYPDYQHWLEEQVLFYQYLADFYRPKTAPNFIDKGQGDE